MDLVTTNQKTMSSREIADLVEARHNDVIATIERLFGKGLLRSSRKSRQEPTGGRPIEVFDLCRRDTLLVAAGYNDELRARVIDRWEELEAQVAAPAHALPQTFAQALMLAAHQAAQIEQQQAQLEAAKPAVEFVGRYVQAEGLKGFREVCKLLKANETDFRIFLMGQKIMYRLAGKLMAYQPHIDAGRFAIKAGIAQANEHAYNDCKFTPKGIEWIAGEWAKYRLRESVEA